MAQAGVQSVAVNPDVYRLRRPSASIPRSSQARKQPSRPPLATALSDQAGSAQYRRELDAIFFAIDPNSSHDDLEEQSSSDESTATSTDFARKCYDFEHDLRLMEDTDIHDVAHWMRQYVSCRLCIARVRNAMRIYAAYQWYEARQRVSEATKKQLAVMEGGTLNFAALLEEEQDENAHELNALVWESLDLT